MSKKVVYVEDNPLNRKVVESLLTANGYEVAELSSDFKDTPAFVRKHKPVAVLLDIQLVGISGMDIVKEIKQEDDIKGIPVIAVTALAMKNDREAILKAGCDDYITKPFKIDELLAVLSKWVEA